MKTFIIVLCFFYATLINATVLLKPAYIVKQIKQAEYDCLYQYTIEQIKFYEGFSATWYDDEGYQAIGYGQRRLYYNKLIQEPVSQEQAEEILKNSFNNHINMVKRCYPSLSSIETLAVAHMSYCIGIGKIKRNGLISNNKLNSNKLLSIRFKQRRLFELNLFNYEKHQSLCSLSGTDLQPKSQLWYTCIQNDREGDFNNFTKKAKKV